MLLLRTLRYLKQGVHSKKRMKLYFYVKMAETVINPSSDRFSKKAGIQSGYNN